MFFSLTKPAKWLLATQEWLSLNLVCLFSWRNSAPSAVLTIVKECSREVLLVFLEWGKGRDAIEADVEKRVPARQLNFLAYPLQCNNQDLTVTLKENLSPHNPQQYAIHNYVQNYALLTYPLPKVFIYYSYYPDNTNTSKEKAQTDERTLASWWHADPHQTHWHDCRHHFYSLLAQSHDTPLLRPKSFA